ncbi:Uncharacterized protein APZ42_011529 [Daphnia magna]|uniref:Uncharacterized protein n=1 Tax=Daphnia magna TaxID=35525 RepID=A0A162SS08_9CRUS|nr:Uncharacterized protein APZ42_011529 [Daphnia magna]
MYLDKNDNNFTFVCVWVSSSFPLYPPSLYTPLVIYCGSDAFPFQEISEPSACEITTPIRYDIGWGRRSFTLC